MAGLLRSLWQSMRRPDGLWHRVRPDSTLEIKLSEHARKRALASGGRIYLWCDGAGFAHGSAEAPPDFESRVEVSTRGICIALGAGAGWADRIVIEAMPLTDRYLVTSSHSMDGEPSGGIPG